MSINDITPNAETARRATRRIARLERRLRQIDTRGKTEKQAGEVSALKWAIPILEEYVLYKYGKMPHKRVEYWKHEYEKIKENLINDYGSNCFMCGSAYKFRELTIDHYIPIDFGGKDEYDNYRLCCEPCNSKKGNKMLNLMEDKI